MIVVFDLYDVLVDRDGSKLPPSRLLLEYQGAGLSYALVVEDAVEEIRKTINKAGLPVIPVLGFDTTPTGRVQVIEASGCSRPGVYVSNHSSTTPCGWGMVTYQGQLYYELVHRIWKESPEVDMTA